ncbi:hypothetical protein ACFFQF_20035 [Haladaptatus pallidirubidus]|uniref:Uncharacterized protein n=1 Tax=Haladaptatus pallidirubidus TaxID=1008152 RepID=A0AAV3UQ03_9EURY|nr:hypothetical protein [Haladaptatus pallidirubidus]
MVVDRSLTTLHIDIFTDVFHIVLGKKNGALGRMETRRVLVHPAHVIPTWKDHEFETGRYQFSKTISKLHEPSIYTPLPEFKARIPLSSMLTISKTTITSRILGISTATRKTG